VKKAKSELNDWGRPEYKRSDFGKLVRGKYAKLSQADREKVESEYHRKNPEDFDLSMSRAKPYARETIRFSNRSTSKRRGNATEKPRGLLKK
jgi:hypothetical protein